MRLTLGQFKARVNSVAASINIAPCDPRFAELANDAQHRLADMGKWWGTYRRMYVCLSQSCLTWPREVAAIEGMQVCRKGIRLRNEWYEFGDAVESPTDDDCGDPVMEDRPNVSQFTDLTAAAKFRIYPTVAADAGAKVVLQGLSSGVTIRTSISGTYGDGEQITLASPFSTSTFTFDAPGLTGVQKPATKGRLNVFSVDPSTGDETLVAFWEPSETAPSYRRSYVRNIPENCECCGDSGNGCDTVPTCASTLAEAIVRMEFVPVVADTDWMFIGNHAAIAAGMRAVALEERHEYNAAEAEWGIAKRILRNELEKYSPRAKITINPRTHGTARPWRVFGGFI